MVIFETLHFARGASLAEGWALIGFWTVLMLNLRLAVAITHFLLMPTVAIARELWLRLDNQHVNPNILGSIFDSLYTNFMIRVMSSRGVFLLMGGIGFRVIGEVVTIAGDIAVLAGRKPLLWTHLDRVLDGLSSGPMVLGAAMVSAAIADNRNVSFLISVGYLATGVGLATVAATY